MGIPWRTARRLIPDLDALLASRPPRAVAPPGVPACTRVEARPGWWRVTVAGWHPASDNVRAKGLWRWIAAKGRDRAVVRACLVEVAGVPRATGRRRLSAWVTKRGPLLDGPNLLKSLCDACVDAGLLVDDGPAWAEVVVPVVARGDRVETVILLEDIP